MSAVPNVTVSRDTGRLPVTLPALAEKKRLGEPIVMVTAYDFPWPRSPRRPASTWSSSGTPAR